jgi:hypothetical protein
MLHGDCLGRAVLGARPALHAGVAVFDPGMPIIHAQDSMRANKEAHTATRAFFLVELQSNDIRQISQFFHLSYLKDFILAADPRRPAKTLLAADPRRQTAGRRNQPFNVNALRAY